MNSSQIMSRLSKVNFATCGMIRFCNFFYHPLFNTIIENRRGILDCIAVLYCWLAFMLGIHVLEFGPSLQEHRYGIVIQHILIGCADINLQVIAFAPCNKALSQSLRTVYCMSLDRQGWNLTGGLRHMTTMQGFYRIFYILCCVE